MVYPENKINLIIDTDPGVDDTIALLAAFNSDKLNIVGITTIYGNVPVDLAAKNALTLLEMTNNTHIPVFKGSELTLNGKQIDDFPVFIHGHNGFGDCIDFPEPTTKKEDMIASDFIVEKCNDNIGEITILCLGPLTNIALAIQKDPLIGDKWKKLVLMGGAFYVPGNITQKAEANVYNDPHAADLIFQKCRNVDIIGLDVTMDVFITHEYFLSILKNSKYADFIEKMSNLYFEAYEKKFPSKGGAVHDASALIALLIPDICEWEKASICVDTEDGICLGATKTKIDGGNRPLNNIAIKIKKEKIISCLMNLLKY